MTQPDKAKPKHDWRNWAQYLGDCNRMMGGTLFENNVFGQNLFIEMLCKYVWDNADGSDQYKQQCIERALIEAGVRIDRARTDKMVGSGSYGAVQIRRIGFVHRHADKFIVVRPSKATGCAIVFLLALLIICGKAILKLI
jgi:hypothetical protein